MELMRAVERVWHRARHMIRAGRITGSDDSGNAQIVQVRLSDKELRDHTRMLTIHGLASRPHKDTDVVVLFIGGDRSAGVGIATSHQQKRLKNLQEGEVALYDDKGKKIHLTQGQGLLVRGADQNIDIRVDDGAKVIVIAPSIEMKADEETLRKLVTEQFQNVYNNHHHGNGSPPNLQMTADHLTNAFRAGGAS